jgi:hypothetical protein
MTLSSNVQTLARAGYAARGVVFLLVAGLALFSSLGGGEADTGSALQSLFEQPFGRIWVGLIGLGLVGFVVWRLAQSLGNADGHDTKVKGYVIRAALFGSAVTYAGLAVTALSLAALSGSGSGSGGEKGLATWIMSQPFGLYLAALVGFGFIIGGGVTAAKGITRSFGRYLDIDVDRNSPAVLVSIYGLVARGVVFAVIGGFFVYAAFTVNPDQAGGMADALTFVRGLPFGGILYAIVAVGLAAFGLYNFVEARHRIVRTPNLPDAGRIRRSLPV